MAWTTGTAAGHVDLLLKLKAYLEDSGWVILDEIITNSATGDRELYVKGVGTDGTDAIYLGLKSATDVNLGCYNWCIKGMTDYINGLSFEKQPGYVISTTSAANGYTYYPLFLLNSVNMQYWFIVNSRRFIVIVNSGSLWSGIYGGFIKPYAPSSILPYPLFFSSSYYGAAMTSATAVSSNVTFDHSMGMTYPCKQAGSSAYYPVLSPGNAFFYDNSFVNVFAYYITVLNSTGAGASNDLYQASMFPVCAGAQASLTSGGVGMLDGAVLLIPRILFYIPDTPLYYGELDGVYAVCGQDKASGDILQYNGLDYLIVQNIHRTTKEQYSAIALA